MSKKIDIKSTILAVINLAVCLLLIILKTPAKVPIFFDFRENIIAFCSKWILILCVIIPTILCIIINLTKKKDSLNFFLKMLFYTCIYENMLIFICTANTECFALNSLYEIPLSLMLFLPISAYMIIGSIKIKHLKYKAFSPFKNKYTLSTEFIWTQTHFYARNILFLVGFIFFILTIIFAIFRLLIINLICLILAIAIIYFCVIRESKQMHNKHNEMQAKKDKLDAEKAQK